jgi:hypothetical protein
MSCAPLLKLDLIRHSYHPTALVLNCDNYYFDPYQNGADYVMTDPYPVGINATYSKWGTVCNTTYGDCGCDDCIGELQDVSNRLDDFSNYYSWLGEAAKPLWAVLQAFSGEGYWARDPTEKETWVMMVLSFNHRAKGIMSWTFPASGTLEVAHGEMAKVATKAPVADFIIGGSPTKVLVEGYELLDVAYWEWDNQTMLGLANGDYVGHDDTVTIQLPTSVKEVSSQPWGSLSWNVVGNKTLTVSGFEGLDTSFMVLC